MQIADFHEVRFPTDISRKARGGPTRRTDIVTLASGREQRNARWAHSRRKYDAGYGVKSLAALSAVAAFFEERRGRLIGFRWKDPLDFSSAAPGAQVTALDQPIGVGTGRIAFPARQDLWRRGPYVRPIRKPVPGTARIAVAGQALGAQGFTLDATTGLVTLAAAPPAGAAVTAASSSTCRCASTPTSSTSSSRPSARARSRAFPSSS